MTVNLPFTAHLHIVGGHLNGFPALLTASLHISMSPVVGPQNKICTEVFL